MQYNNSYNNFPPIPGAQQVSTDTRVSNVMKRVYLKMFFGLIVTALTALFCATSPAVINLFAANRWLMWVLVGVEFLLLFGIQGAVRSMSGSRATLMFYLFAVVNGAMLFPIFYAYSPSIIYKTFFITAGVFGAMSVYGFFTTRSLTGIGTFLSMALIGLLIALLVNIFVHSSQLDYIISIAGVLIFVGLTAWDTQQIKQMALAMPGDSAAHLATLGALTLYLDFINLFIYLLRFLGGNRR